MFDKVITTNLRGTFLVLAQAAQHVTDGGRILALSSSVVAKSTPTYGAYIASKAGVEGLIRFLLLSFGDATSVSMQWRPDLLPRPCF